MPTPDKGKTVTFLTLNKVTREQYKKMKKAGITRTSEFYIMEPDSDFPEIAESINSHNSSNQSHSDIRAELKGKAEKSALSDYATKKELASRASADTVSNLQSKVASLESSKADKSQLSNYATVSQLNAKADSSAVTEALRNKVDSATLSNKVVTSIDGKQGALTRRQITEAFPLNTQSVEDLTGMQLASLGICSFAFGSKVHGNVRPTDWSSVLCYPMGTGACLLGVNINNRFFVKYLNDNEKGKDKEWTELLSPLNIDDKLLWTNFSLLGKKSSDFAKLGFCRLAMSSGASKNGYPSEYSTVINIPAINRKYPDCRQLCIDAYGHLWVRTLNNDESSESVPWQRVITNTTETQIIQGSLHVKGAISTAGPMYLGIENVDLENSTSVINVGRADERYVRQEKFDELKKQVEKLLADKG